uniref:Uncharacterized protein n=1 Tax=Leersia perrieri TaxID=77586 RepID=A0A0D9WL68_9ORYZ
MATTTTKLQEAAASRRSSWSTKHYILLALAGTLMATIIVIAISAVFSPTEINFSVTNATHAKSSDGGIRVNLTVAAANTGSSSSSWRCAGVEYRSLSVELLYTPKDGVPKSLMADKPLQALSSTTSAPFVQPARNTTTFPVHIFLAADYLRDNFRGDTINSTKTSVQVTASVRFIVVGKAYTRLYDIDVLCDLGFALFHDDQDDDEVSLFGDGSRDCFPVGSDD